MNRVSTTPSSLPLPREKHIITLTQLITPQTFQIIGELGGLCAGPVTVRFSRVSALCINCAYTRVQGAGERRLVTEALKYFW